MLLFINYCYFPYEQLLTYFCPSCIYLFIYVERPLKWVRLGFSGFCVDEASLEALKVSCLKDTHSLWSPAPSPGDSGKGGVMNAPSFKEMCPHQVSDSSFSGGQSPQSSGDFKRLKSLFPDMNLVAISSSYITGFQLGYLPLKI